MCVCVCVCDSVCAYMELYSQAGGKARKIKTHVISSSKINFFFFFKTEEEEEEVYGCAHRGFDNKQTIPRPSYVEISLAA